jgi:hypothetical protein
MTYAEIVEALRVAGHQTIVTALEQRVLSSGGGDGGIPDAWRGYFAEAISDARGERFVPTAFDIICCPDSSFARAVASYLLPPTVIELGNGDNP